MAERGRALGNLAAAAALAVLAAAVLSLPPAQQAEAQTTVTLVSNTGQTTAATRAFNDRFAAAFTTGANTGGYTLTSIDLVMTVSQALTSDQRESVKVQVWSNSSGSPNEKLWDLTVPSSLSSGTVSLAAPSNTTLTASTTYHLVIDLSGTNSRVTLPNTNSNDEDTGAAAGWSIADTSRRESGSNWSSRSYLPRFQVKGYANQASTTTASSSTTAASSTTAPTTTPSTVPSTTASTTSTTATTAPASTKTFRIESTKTVNEGANAALTVTLGEAAPAGGLALSVTYDYSGSTATADDTGTTPATVTVAATRTTATLTIPIAHDALVEGDETFTATISTAVAGWNGVSGQVAATVTITDDDDDTARIAFGNVFTTTAKQTFSVAENVQGGVLTVPIIISHNPQSDFTVNVTVETGGTATEYVSAQNPGDFRIQTKSVTFTPTGNRQQNLTIAITNDTLLEENQTIELKISDSTSGTLGALYTRHAMGRLAKVTITDDERTGARIAFGANPASTAAYTDDEEEDVSGGSLTVPVIVNRRPETDTEFTVTVLTTGSNNASEWQSTSDPGDYRIADKTVTFGPGDTADSSGNVTKNITVAIENDSLVEEDQKIRLRIADSTGSTNLGRHYTRNAQSRTATLTIEDDEADEATIAFTILPLPASRAEFEAEAFENVSTGRLDVPVTISAKPESEFTVNVTVVSSGTTATEGVDFSIGTKSVTFGPSRSVEQAIRITFTNDMLVEEDQTIKLRLAAAGTGLDRFYTRDTAEMDDMDGVSTEATATIKDDERGSAKIAFGTSASSTTKYTADVDEDDGTVNVPVTITDLPETSTTFRVEVLETATRPATQYTSSSNPGDYRVLGSKRVTFGPTGAKSRNVQVRLNNNSLVEHPETVQLRIVAARASTHMDFDLGDHYARNAQSRLATLTVADDDAAAAKIAVGNSAGSQSVFAVDRREGTGGGASFNYDLPFRVSHGPSEATTFTLDVLGTGTATAGDDFTAVSTTSTLSAGATSGTFRFSILNDSWVEDDQTILVRIAAKDATVDDLGDYYDRHADGSRGTITISDDEQRAAKVAFGTNAASVIRYLATGEEVVGTLKVPIIINHLPESDTTFAVEVLSTGTTARETADSGNTAGNPRDFEIATKSVTFGPATDKSMDLTVSIDNDVVEEDDEFIVLRIVAKDNPVDDLGDHYDRHALGARSRVTVRSEDAVSKVTLSTSAAAFVGQYYRVYEGTQATLTATADIPVGPGGWRVTPSRRTGQGFSGTGWAGSGDVRFESFTIPEGQTTATGTVRFLSDTVDEPQEVLLIQGRAQRRSRSLTTALSGLVQLKGLFVQIFNSGAGATLSATQLEMVEDEAVTYKISLNTAPTANVVVTPATLELGDRDRVGGAHVHLDELFAAPGGDRDRCGGRHRHDQPRRHLDRHQLQRPVGAECDREGARARQDVHPGRQGHRPVDRDRHRGHPHRAGGHPRRARPHRRAVDDRHPQHRHHHPVHPHRSRGGAARHPQRKHRGRHHPVRCHRHPHRHAVRHRVDAQAHRGRQSRRELLRRRRRRSVRRVRRIGHHHRPDQRLHRVGRRERVGRRPQRAGDHQRAAC